MSEAAKHSEEKTLGELMAIARQAKKDHEVAAANERAAKERFDAAKLAILQKMRIDEQDSASVSGVARARVSTKIVPNVTDWDKVYSYILDHNLPELLQKRILLAGYNDLRQSGEEIPGIEDFEKEELTFTVIND